MAANGLTSTTIHPGQQLLIPVGPVTPVTPTWTPTPIPPTATPSPTPTDTPTLTPRPIPALTPTATPAPTATTTATYTPTPTSAIITLLEPANGASVSGLVTFRWTWAWTWEPGETFDLKVCKGEGCQPKFGITNTRDTTWPNWCPPGGVGVYRWKVEVIDDATKQPKGLTSEVWDFDWRGGCPSDGPTPTSTPR